MHNPQDAGKRLLLRGAQWNLDSPTVSVDLVVLSVSLLAGQLNSVFLVQVFVHSVTDTTLQGLVSRVS